jgi:hypothetical protein
MPELQFLPPYDYQPGDSIPTWRRIASDLYAQLADPGPGRCQSVPGLDSVPGLVLAAPGLVVNPTKQQADAALTYAINRAASDTAVLLVYYVGHG